MKVRTKFTALISLASFMAVAFSSAFIFRQLKEDFYELVDYDLAEAAELIYSQFEVPENSGSEFAPAAPKYLLKNYWLRVSSDTGQILMTTPLAERVQLPTANSDKPYCVKLHIPREYLHIPPEEADEVQTDKIKLRNRVFSREINEQTIIVHIAKPVLLIHTEFKELLLELVWGVLGTIVLIFYTSFFIAGRILHPLSVINRKVTDIREQSLSERIPLGKSHDELHTLSASLNSMFDRLEHSFHRQRDFIGNAAHEMKSPLTILMLGHEEMLANNPEKKVRNALEKQLHTMQRLNKLIRDLLSIARLEQRDTLQRQEFLLSTLIEDILEDYEEIITEKQIQVTTDLSPVMIFADYEKFLRLFINLIDNAIKYNSSSKGIIIISLKKHNKNVIISIANSGETIPAKDLPHIYKQFYRVEKSRSQAYGGTGLGLTIARRIVDMHTGTIVAVSNENLTTVTITFPENQLN